MKGKVIESTGSWYVVFLQEQNKKINARLKGKFKQKEEIFTNPIAVGDDVQLVYDNTSGDYVIEEILSRKNYMIRQSPRKKFQTHIIASNIDIAVVIYTFLNPRTPLGFLDRFLVMAESFHIPVTIIVNKIDTHKSKEIEKLRHLKELYEPLGYDVLPISLAEEKGLDEVKKVFDGKITLISGMSGAGKSTLINYLSPELKLRTSKVSSKTGKGMHTTTYATMYQLYKDTYVIDTPGIKELATVGITPEELSGYFPEMQEVRNNCKFNNCLHRNEPGCAVLKAVEQEKISTYRYQSYLNILEDIESVNSWERL